MRIGDVAISPIKKRPVLRLTENRAFTFYCEFRMIRAVVSTFISRMITYVATESFTPDADRAICTLEIIIVYR